MDSVALSRKFSIVALLLLGLAGCEENESTGGAGGAGAAGAGGAGGNGAGGTGGAGATGGTGGTGGGQDCSFYETELGPPDQEITVVIQNNGMAPVYLGELTPGCQSSPGYRVETPGGESVKTQLGSCEFTCSHLAKNSCACAADCAQPVVTMIHPGGAYQTSWIQRVYTTDEMPEACYEDPTCVQPDCLMANNATSPLVFLADGYAELGDCTEAICDCDGGVAGSCIVEGAMTVAGAPTIAETTWDPGALTITITFE